MGNRRSGKARELTEWLTQGRVGKICNGKNVYNRKKTARTKASQSRAATGDNNIVAYACPDGSHFHIGHDRSYEDRQARKEAKAKAHPAAKPLLSQDTRTAVPLLVAEKQIRFSPVESVITRLWSSMGEE